MFFTTSAYGNQEIYNNTFASKQIVEKAFPDDLDRSIIAIKAKAVKVDLVADTSLATTVTDITERYSKLFSALRNLQAEVQTDVYNFLDLDVSFLKDKSIPFVSRIAYLKNAARKVFNASDKASPVAEEMKKLRSILALATTDSEILPPIVIEPASVSEHDFVVGAFQVVQSKLISAQEGLLSTVAEAKGLEARLDSDGLSEDSFNFGDFISETANIGIFIARVSL